MMINIIKAFKEVWLFQLSSKSQIDLKNNTSFGKSEIGVSEFFKSLEVFSKSKKYSFK